MFYLLALFFTILLVVFFKLIERKITVGIWSIKVFHSDTFISKPLDDNLLIKPTLQASDVTDVSAEFIADPFIIHCNSKFYMFFEVLDKSSGKGVIGLATSVCGQKWEYEKIVLKESYHLSYPYVFMNGGEYYMIPESSEASKVFLYRAKNFPFEWDLDRILINGRYVDSSLFHYDSRWWLFAAKHGNLHLFYSNKFEGVWIEHPKSPLISNNVNITRPGGRVIVNEDEIYRYTQDGQPNYGSAVRVFRITKLSEVDYHEEEINLILTGTNQENDWRKDGMHSIDQLKLSKDKWLIAVDGHKLLKRNFLLWKLDCYKAKLHNFIAKGFWHAIFNYSGK